jgi:hypothetical protein
MRQNHGRGRTGDQFDEKIVIVRGALGKIVQLLPKINLGSAREADAASSSLVIGAWSPACDLWAAATATAAARKRH